MPSRLGLFAFLACMAQAVPALACVVVDGELRPYTAADEALARRQSAALHSFFIEQEVLLLGGHSYVKYGLPRTVDPDLLALAAFYDGVAVFRAAGDENVLPDVFYFLADATDCSFQPYQIEVAVE